MPNKINLHVVHGDALSYADFSHIKRCLNSRGFCILPSDTGYSLSVLADSKDTVEAACKVLGKTDAIPLAFGSLPMVWRYVNLTPQDERVIWDDKDRGPITLVCKIREDKDPAWREAVENVLHSRDTIGIRIPRSGIERWVSIEMDQPITTCAIRYPDGKIVQSFDDAVNIVRTCMLDFGMTRMLVAVESIICYSDHSTVLTVQPKLARPFVVRVYREGAADPEIVERIVTRFGFPDTEDFT